MPCGERSTSPGATQRPRAGSAPGKRRSQCSTAPRLRYCRLYSAGRQRDSLQVSERPARYRVMLNTLTIDRPEQLKALGHPLRLRVLEELGAHTESLTNRELAQRLGVDPGHLHFPADRKS